MPEFRIRALLVVDVQNGFIADGSRHVPENVAALIRAYRFEKTVFTRFINWENSPYIRLLGWDLMHPHHIPDIEIVDVLKPYAQHVIDKGIYGGFPAELAAEFRAAGIEEVVVTGIETDACVLKTVFDVFDANFDVCVVSDCCGSTGGGTFHEDALAIMGRSIGTQNILTREQFLTEKSSHPSPPSPT